MNAKETMALLGTVGGNYAAPYRGDPDLTNGQALYGIALSLWRASPFYVMGAICRDNPMVTGEVAERAILRWHSGSRWPGAWPLDAEAARSWAVPLWEGE